MHEHHAQADEGSAAETDHDVCGEVQDDSEPRVHAATRRITSSNAGALFVK